MALNKILPALGQIDFILGRDRQLAQVMNAIGKEEEPVDAMSFIEQRGGKAIADSAAWAE